MDESKTSAPVKPIESAEEVLTLKASSIYLAKGFALGFIPTFFIVCLYNSFDFADALPISIFFGIVFGILAAIGGRKAVKYLGTIIEAGW